MRISASLLSSDLLNLNAEIDLLTEAGVDCFHIDVMDGHFVPNIAFGIDIIKQISKVSKLPISVHLMVDNPDQFINVVSYYNVNYILVHSEGSRNIEGLLTRIKDNGVGAGLAINPQTQIHEIKKYIPIVDLALVMGVHPGFGGQTLIPNTLEKIGQLKAVRNDIVVGIDGGINDKTVSIAKAEKPDILIVGSYLFDHKSEDKLGSIREKLKILCHGV